jgi:hypothetical protein
LPYFRAPFSKDESSDYIEKRDWEINYGFEYDHKESKFLSREKSHTLSIGPADSKWSVKFEHAARKNIIEKYSSREFIKNESLNTVKQSIGLQYA